MTTFKHTTSVASLSLIVLASCSVGPVDPAAQPLIDADVVDPTSLEGKLGLIPQTMSAADLSSAGRTLKGSISRYVILSTEAGALDIDAIGITNQEEGARSLTELFATAPPARAGLLERDALLLVAVPKDDVEQLCERFQLAHDSADLVTSKDETSLFLATLPEGRVHALCLLPTSGDENVVGQLSTAKSTASGGTQSYGGGNYTVRIKSLKCNDPHDWENWPYTGDKARMGASYDSSGAAQIWGTDHVGSGKVYYPNRYISFTNAAKVELYDYDSGFWNANDKLGSVSIYSSDACYGDRNGDFDGNGGGHTWNYDMTYRVYGPACSCQSQEPAIYTYSQAETCSVTSSAVTGYTGYCSGGIYWSQAWGNVVRHCQTFGITNNESCEMKTFVSSTLASECDKYAYNVAIGGPVQAGTCSSDPCNPQQPQLDVLKACPLPEAK